MNQNHHPQQKVSDADNRRPFDLKVIRLEISERYATALLKFSRSLSRELLATCISDGESLEELFNAVDELAFALARDLREQRG